MNDWVVIGWKWTGILPEQSMYFVGCVELLFDVLAVTVDGFEIEHVLTFQDM